MNNPSWRRVRIAFPLMLGLALSGCGASGIGTRVPKPHASPTLSPCQTSQLTLSVVETDSASGRLRILYEFTNHSTAVCALKGYPVVTNAGARIQIHDVAQQYTWKTAPIDPIALGPAASAYFAIQVQPSAEFAGDTCATATPAFSPPGDPTGFAAPVSITTCNGIIYVSPLVANRNDL